MKCVNTFSQVLALQVLLSAALRDFDAPQRSGSRAKSEDLLDSADERGVAELASLSVEEEEAVAPPMVAALFQTSIELSSRAADPASEEAEKAKEQQSALEAEQEQSASEAMALFETTAELNMTAADALADGSPLPPPMPPILLLIPAFGGLLDDDENQHEGGDQTPQIDLDSRERAAAAAASTSRTATSVILGLYTASGSVTVWLVTAVLVAALIIAGTVLFTMPPSKGPDSDERQDRRSFPRRAQAATLEGQRAQRPFPPGRNQPPGQIGAAGLGQPGQMQPDLLVQAAGAAQSPSFAERESAGGANAAQMQANLLRSPGGSFAGHDASGPSAPPSPLYTSARGMNMSDMSSGEREDTMPLATGLVVNNLDGLGIAIPWELGPGPQDTVVVIRDLATKNTIANAFVSERGPDPGILLETAQRDTFAFLDTSLALVGFGAVAQTNRRVVLRRASVGGWDVAGPPYAVLFLNTNAGGSTLIARRGGPAGRVGRNLLSLNMDANGQVINVVDATGRLMATAESAEASSPILRAATWSPGQQQTTPRQTLLRIAVGADAGLVLCAVFGAHKLR